MKPWEGVTQIEQFHSYDITVDGQPTRIVSHISSVAETREAAETCGHVAFRSILDTIGVPWRTLSGDERGADQEGDQRDPQ